MLTKKDINFGIINSIFKGIFEEYDSDYVDSVKAEYKKIRDNDYISAINTKHSDVISSGNSLAKSKPEFGSSFSGFYQFLDQCAEELMYPRSKTAEKAAAIRNWMLTTESFFKLEPKISQRYKMVAIIEDQAVLDPNDPDCDEETPPEDFVRKNIEIETIITNEINPRFPNNRILPSKVTRVDYVNQYNIMRELEYTRKSNLRDLARANDLELKLQKKEEKACEKLDQRKEIVKNVVQNKIKYHTRKEEDQSERRNLRLISDLMYVIDMINRDLKGKGKKSMQLSQPY